MISDKDGTRLQPRSGRTTGVSVCVGVCLCSAAFPPEGGAIFLLEVGNGSLEGAGHDLRRRHAKDSVIKR